MASLIRIIKKHDFSVLSINGQGMKILLPHSYSGTYLRIAGFGEGVRTEDVIER